LAAHTFGCPTLVDLLLSGARQPPEPTATPPHPSALHLPQLYECEQAIAYLRTLVAGAGAGPSDASKAAALEEAPAPGMKLLKKKDDDLEGLYGGGAKKGKGAKREAARVAATEAAKVAKVRGATR
jgi:hypothetical protein